MSLTTNGHPQAGTRPVVAPESEGAATAPRLAGSRLALAGVVLYLCEFVGLALSHPGRRPEVSAPLVGPEKCWVHRVGLAPGVRTWSE